MTGVFVVFEGGEGSGKSTQASRLAERLGAVLTLEPGGTEIGQRLRDVVLGDGGSTLAPRAEALLMAADRAQHVAEVVRPALEAGRPVVSDRFSGSTLAYQGYGRGLDLGDLARLSGWATEGLEPDVVFLLDVDQEVAAARRCRPRDRIEAAGDTFHQRVVAGYQALAAADPDRWVVVDGSGTVDEVAARVWSAYEAWEAGAG
ncbi:MAG: dTMP kinase [Actinomycetota bacterium]|jgi:dTMP kinase|nr:dTMP kinase [Actinomycetota bacterium]